MSVEELKGVVEIAKVFLQANARMKMSFGSELH